MKLIRCYIAGFGRFVGEEIVFDESLHTVYEKNGYGKTTLAQFISAMLYGMPTERANSENIRGRYLPWSGAKYGGMLEFSASGEIYRIERTFDSKSETKDKLKFSCENKPETDLSLDGKTPGEYFLGISKDTFIRTVFYSGTPEKDKKSDLISRVAATLSGSTDTEGYQKALNLLDKQRKTYRLDKGTGGCLDETKDELLEKRSALREAIAAEKSATELEAELQNKKREKANLERKIKEQETYTSYEQSLKVFTDAEEEKKAEYEQKIEHFPLLPSESRLAKLKELATNVSEPNSEDYQLAKGEQAEYCTLSAYFSEKTEAKIDEIEKKIQDVKTKNSALEALKDPRTDTFRTYSTTLTEADFQRLDAIYTAYLSASEKRDTAAPAEKMPMYILLLLILGIIGAVAGGALLTVNIVLGILMMIFGLVAAVAGVILLTKQKSSAAQSSAFVREYQTQRTKLCNDLDRVGYTTGTPEERYHRLSADRKEYLRISKEYEAYKEETSEIKKTIEPLEKEITEFFNKFPAPDQMSDDDALKAVRKLYARYQLLVTKKEDRATAFQKESARYQQACEAFLKEADAFSYDRSLTEVCEIFKAIEDAFKSVSDCKKEWDGAKKQTAKFCKDNIPPKKPEACDIDKVKERITELEGEIETAVRDLHTARQIADGRETLEREIEELTDKLNEYTVQFKLLVKTKKLLEKANDTLKTEIASPLHHAYCKYADQVDPSLSKALKVDLSSLSFLYERDGAYRKVEHFSTGQRAISDICLRFALIDLIYEKEKPCLILDDPFVHLDGDNLKNALTALKTLSKDLQIIYLTCHESRTI